MSYFPLAIDETKSQNHLPYGLIFFYELFSWKININLFAGESTCYNNKHDLRFIYCPVIAMKISLLSKIGF